MFVCVCVFVGGWVGGCVCVRAMPALTQCTALVSLCAFSEAEARRLAAFQR